MSTRVRKRAGAHKVVTYDPDRTPRGSGAYGVMKDACEYTINRLVGWGDRRLTSKERDIRVAAECAMALAQQASTLLAQIETWPEREPIPETKTAIINEVLRIREVAMQLLQRNGANL